MIDQIIKTINEVKELDNLNENSPLFSGLMDSFDLLTLISELEDEFEISIPGELLVPENFETPLAISKLIQKVNK